MRSQLTKIWTVVVLFLAFAPVLADDPHDKAQPANTVVMGDHGRDPTYTNYFFRLADITYGSTLVYKSVLGNKSFRVGELLGEGHTTRVYELLDHPDKVLRIPSEHSRHWHPRFLKNSWINATIKGSKVIEKAGIPSVKIHDYRYDQYVVVDRVNGFTLEEYILNINKYSPNERDKIEADLIAFALTTSEYSKIDDFRAEQLMYDKEKGWLLTDWMLKIHKSKNPYDTVFSPVAELFYQSTRTKTATYYASQLMKRVVTEIQYKKGLLTQNHCPQLF